MMNNRGPVPKTKPSFLADYLELLLVSGVHTQITRADVHSEFQQGAEDPEPEDEIPECSDAELVNVAERSVVNGDPNPRKYGGEGDFRGFQTLSINLNCG